MIVDNGKYYLYRHIRLDKNEPFYIGIGTKQKRKYENCYNCIHGRAFSKSQRNNFWKKVISKTEYEVEIFLESNDYKFIKQKEIEFIFLYGRKDLKTGTLVNLTSGGDAVCDKIKRYGKENPASRKILQYNLKGEFIQIYDSIIEASSINEINEHHIRDCLRLNKNKNYSIDKYRKTGNFIWLYFVHNYQQNITIIPNSNSSYKRAKKYYQYDLEGNFIQEWLGRDSICKYYNWKRATVGGFLKNKTNLGNNFFWFNEKLQKEEVLLHKSIINKQILVRQLNKKY
jgi:hypothetical protein